MLPSHKQVGNFEEKIIKKVKKYFQNEGYLVYTHSRLNVAWSTILSDIDILAILNDEVIITEVKSERDNLNKAFTQLQNIKGFSDKLFIATDKNIKNINLDKWEDEDIGLLHVKNDVIKKIKIAKNIQHLPDDEAFIKLKKKCLVKLVKLLGLPSSMTKKQMEIRLRENYNEYDLKLIAKNIALCNENCDTGCILDPKLSETDINIRRK